MKRDAIFSLQRACLYGTSWFCKATYTSAQKFTSTLIWTETANFTLMRSRLVHLTKISTENPKIVISQNENFSYEQRQASQHDWPERNCAYLENRIWHQMTIWCFKVQQVSFTINDDTIKDDTFTDNTINRFSLENANTPSNTPSCYFLF